MVHHAPTPVFGEKTTHRRPRTTHRRPRTTRRRPFSARKPRTDSPSAWRTCTGSTFRPAETPAGSTNGPFVRTVGRLWERFVRTVAAGSTFRSSRSAHGSRRVHFSAGGSAPGARRVHFSTAKPQLLHTKPPWVCKAGGFATEKTPQTSVSAHPAAPGVQSRVSSCPIRKKQPPQMGISLHVAFAALCSQVLIESFVETTRYCGADYGVGRNWRGHAGDCAHGEGP